MNQKKKQIKLESLNNFSLNLIIFILFSSCNLPKDKYIRKKLEGQWAIENFICGHSNYIDSFYVNFMVIEPNGYISLPEGKNIAKDLKSEWILLTDENNDSLIINSKNNLFDGKYSLKFIKDYDKKLIGFELRSDSTHIKAFKLLQDFKSDGEYWSDL
jgi:hypothetical protein